MAEKFIDIKIATDGTIEVHTSGYQGTECEEELRKISRALGQPVTVKRLASYYDQNTQQQENKQS